MSDVEQLARETRSSIEVTRNSKADYQWVIKLYFDAETEIVVDSPTDEEPALGEASEALRLIELIDTRLRNQFLPHAVGFDGQAIKAGEVR